MILCAISAVCHLTQLKYKMGKMGHGAIVIFRLPYTFQGGIATGKSPSAYYFLGFLEKGHILASNLLVLNLT